VSKRCQFIAALVLSFSLALALSAFAHCVLAHDSSSPGSTEIPGFISCPEAEMSPFLRPNYSGHEKAAFAKMQKNVVGGGSVPFLQETAATMILRPPRSVFVTSSVPIYQLQAVYRI
jgi:hypothetical protein